MVFKLSIRIFFILFLSFNLSAQNENILYLIVILLITGPALPDIVATILSIISISILSGIILNLTKRKIN